MPKLSAKGQLSGGLPAVRQRAGTLGRTQGGAGFLASHAGFHRLAGVIPEDSGQSSDGQTGANGGGAGGGTGGDFYLRACYQSN